MTERDDKSLLMSGAAWPGGWYVYENGKVDGPFSAEETFQLGTESSDGKPRLVSRKGFSQWYALKDLSEIFRMTDQMGRKAQQHVEITEAQLAAASAVTSAPVSAKAPITETTVAPKVSKKELKQSKIQAAVESMTKPVVELTAAAVVTPAPMTAPPSAAPATPLAVRVPQSAAPTPLAAAKDRTKAIVMQEYFLARGRLRLGKLRNPWISAFVGMPLTLGFYWAFWLRDLGREVAFHARNADKSPLPPMLLAFVPIMHMVMAYQLAKLIIEMEAQNRYRSVSPTVAALFAIFPPFAMAYLQDAANRHWMLHVKHSMVKKKADEKTDAPDVAT